MKYTTETLYKFCETNNITLIKNYQDNKIKRETYIEGNCSSINCLNIFNKSFRHMVKTGSYCKECTNKIKLHKFIQTNLERYGVEHVLQNKEIVAKIKQTNLERYGVEHPQQNLNIKEKTIQTNLQRYGAKNPLQNTEIIINLNFWQILFFSFVWIY